MWLKVCCPALTASVCERGEMCEARKCAGGGGREKDGRREARRESRREGERARERRMGGERMGGRER